MIGEMAGKDCKQRIERRKAENSWEGFYPAIHRGDERSGYKYEENPADGARVLAGLRGERDSHSTKQEDKPTKSQQPGSCSAEAALYLRTYGLAHLLTRALTHRNGTSNSFRARQTYVNSPSHSRAHSQTQSLAYAAEG